MIPLEIKKQLLEEPQVCARRNKDCGGRITWEHALLYANKKIQERWAIVFLCARHHGLFQYSNCHFLSKAENQKIALRRATREEIVSKYPRLLKRWEIANNA